MNRLSYCRLMLALVVGVAMLSVCRGHAQTVISGQSEIDQQVKSKAVEQLARRCDVDLRDFTLAELAKFVSDRTGLNVLIDEKALEESGVESDKASITVRGQALPLVGIFDHVLDQQQLAWQVRHGAIVITTHEENEQSGLELQVYPVADLLDSTPRRVDEREEFEEPEPLIDLIVTTVAPDSWDEVGGPGSISLLPERSVLVISQMREVHECIERLLTALRATPLAPPIARPTSALQSTPARGSRAIGAPAEGTSRAGTNDSPVRTFRRMTSTPRWLLPRSHE